MDLGNVRTSDHTKYSTHETRIKKVSESKCYYYQEISQLLNRTEHNFIENYASQAVHRWRKRLTQTCYAVK